MLNKVLLIDDDEIVNSINKVMIQHAQFAKEIMVESMAPLALESIKHLNLNNKLPDVIFLDVNMPEMDGWDFMEEYKKIEMMGTAPKVIMLTSSINPKDEKRASSIELVTAYLTKPLSPELLEAIEKDYFQKI